MKIDQEQAREELRHGRAVSFNGRELRKEKDLPAKDAPGVFQALRSPSGNLSRAGMLHVIGQGGSVLHGDAVIDRAEDLPSEDVLAAGDADRLKAVVDAHDEQIANLMAAKARSEKALREAEEAAKNRPAEAEADKAEPKHPAHAQHAQHAKSRQKE